MAPHASIPDPSNSNSTNNTPHLPSDNEHISRLPALPKPAFSASPPKIIVIGAGSRGGAYAEAISRSTNGILVAVAETIEHKRKRYGEKYIWGAGNQPTEGQSFVHWKDFLSWELKRREQVSKGEDVGDALREGIDAAFICVQDAMHKDVIVGLKPLGLHIMCEKPLATSLDDCVEIYRSMLSSGNGKQEKIFSIGHVLRYSPHNMLLRKLLREEKVIGEIMSINHTEPVGWWHFTHSYVRGNWRRESTTAPSLLTKSCHDIDLLLWLLCSPPPNTPASTPAHLPATISSTGSLNYFNRTRKPTAAGKATNCFSCPIEESCKYSAKKIYISGAPKALATGHTSWPVDIVLPEIEDIISHSGEEAGVQALTEKLAEDYTPNTPTSDISSKNWFGRCVYESDNDVCDDQIVTMSWDNDSLPATGEMGTEGRGAKTAIFHMIAHTHKICERYTHIYGSDGEIYADSSTITVQSFLPGINEVNRVQTYRPHLPEGGHGGGDDGLARQFILAVDRVKNHGISVEMAQREEVGCSLEEVVRSHAVVFCAESARRGRKVVDFESWWREEVEGRLGQ